MPSRALRAPRRCGGAGAARAVPGRWRRRLSGWQRRWPLQRPGRPALRKTWATRAKQRVGLASHARVARPRRWIHHEALQCRCGPRVARIALVKRVTPLQDSHTRMHERVALAGSRGRERGLVAARARPPLAGEVSPGVAMVEGASKRYQKLVEERAKASGFSERARLAAAFVVVEARHDQDAVGASRVVMRAEIPPELRSGARIAAARALAEQHRQAAAQPMYEDHETNQWAAARAARAHEPTSRG